MPIDSGAEVFVAVVASSRSTVVSFVSVSSATRRPAHESARSKMEPVDGGEWGWLGGWNTERPFTPNTLSDGKSAIFCVTGTSLQTSIVQIAKVLFTGEKVVVRFPTATAKMLGWTSVIPRTDCRSGQEAARVDVDVDVLSSRPGVTR